MTSPSDASPINIIDNDMEPESGIPTSTHQCHHDDPGVAQSQNVPAKSKRKAPRPRSEVWEHYIKFKDAQGEQKARCKYCEREFYADPKRNGTTSLKSHMVSCKIKSNADESSQTELIFGMGDGFIGTWKFNQDSLRRTLAEMIIVDELPFRFVDNGGFRKWVAESCPKFRMPSRWTVARDCYKLFVDSKTDLKQYLKESLVRVSLTTDTWTSVQRINYLCLTAHFIDKNWTLKKKIINFCPITSHRGEAIAKVIEKCLREWGIERVFTITVDNASSNDVAVTHLKRKLSDLETCIKDGKYLHLRCIAHILNLVVSDGLKDLHESIARVRAVVRFVKASPARCEKFKECASMAKIDCKSFLSLDVSTRWNSTYLMLDVAQKFEKAFYNFEDHDPFFRNELTLGEGLPDKKDWENVRMICLFLEKFYVLTIKVFGSSYITSNSFLFDICKVYSALYKWEKNSDVKLSAMAKRMKEKFDKYYGNAEKMNMLLFVASVLDPRKKFEFVRFCFMEMYSPELSLKMLQLVRNTLQELFEEYKKMLPQCEQVGGGSGSSQVSQMDEDDDFMEQFKKFKKEIGKEENKTELDRYLNEDDGKYDTNFEVLTWWKLNAHRYPVLSNIARDVLAAPISTVASESAFSTGGRVLDAYRSSLTPKIVQALICAQDWLRGSPRFDETETDLAELDKVDLELSKIALDASLD